MAKINGTGLAYRDDVTAVWVTDEGDVLTSTRSVYQMWVANRLVFLVSVVNADPQLRIQLGMPNAEDTNKWHVSVGQAKKSLHLLPASDGGNIPDGLFEHIDGISVQRYIYPRVGQILVNMYELGTVNV